MTFVSPARVSAFMMYQKVLTLLCFKYKQLYVRNHETCRMSNASLCYQRT